MRGRLEHSHTGGQRRSVSDKTYLNDGLHLIIVPKITFDEYVEAHV